MIEYSHKDNGWAWMVCLGTFIIYLIHPSYFYVTSALFLDFMEVFDTSAAMINVILGLTNVVYCISAFVLANVVMSSVSVRTLTTVCSIVSSLATLAVVVAPSLPVFFIACLVKYSAQGGVLVPSLTLVGQYFERRRALATSLALLGISVASVMVPPAVTYLRTEYGFRGCFLLLSAYEMQSIIAGMLLRPIAQTRKRASSQEEPDRNPCPDDRTENVETKLLAEPTDDRTLGVPKDKLTHEPLIGVNRGAVDVLGNQVDESLEKPLCRRQCQEDRTRDTIKNNESDGNALQLENYALINNNLTSKRLEIYMEPTKSRKLKERIKAALDISLLKNYIALLYLFTFGLNHSGAFIATYLPSYAIRSGLSPPDAALLMTIAGSCDAASRVAYGYFADAGVVRPGVILAAACLVLGVACQFVSFCTNLASFSALAVVYGCCGMAHLSLNTPLVVDLLGIANLGKVLALGALASSSFVSAQFPLHGVLISVTGNFTASFYWVGATFLLSSVCLWLEPLVRRCQDKREHTARMSEPKTTKC